MHPRQPSIAEELACRPTTFAVGSHSVVVAMTAATGRWSVTVDGRRAEMTFETEVDAWEDGVRSADSLDRAGAGAAPIAPPIAAR
jgi:hypothetical protein